MKKEEVQMLVLKDGRPLGLSQFNWDEQTQIFSSEESDLVINFKFMKHGHIIAEDRCTIFSGSNVNVDCGFDCAVDVGDGCIVSYLMGGKTRAGNGCIIVSGGSFDISAQKRCSVVVKGTGVIVLGDDGVIIDRNLFRVTQPNPGQIVHINQTFLEGGN